MRVQPLGFILTGTGIGGTIGCGIGYIVGSEYNDIIGFWCLGSVVGTQMGFNVYVNQFHDNRSIKHMIHILF